MKFVFIVLIVAISGILIGWFGYSFLTESIIKDQEREIAKLKADNRRLRKRSI